MVASIPPAEPPMPTMGQTLPSVPRFGHVDLALTPGFAFLRVTGFPFLPSELLAIALPIISLHAYEYKVEPVVHASPARAIPGGTRSPSALLVVERDLRARW